MQVFGEPAHLEPAVFTACPLFLQSLQRTPARHVQALSSPAQPTHPSPPTHLVAQQQGEAVGVVPLPGAAGVEHDGQQISV